MLLLDLIRDFVSALWPFIERARGGQPVSKEMTYMLMVSIVGLAAIFAPGLALDPAALDSAAWAIAEGILDVVGGVIALIGAFGAAARKRRALDEIHAARAVAWAPAEGKVKP